MAENAGKTFRYVKPEQLEELRRQLVRPSAYLKRYLMKMLELVLKSRCVLGLYSRDNVLVELFAKDRQKQELLEQEGIRPGCIWNEIGYNAVEEGQTYFRPCSSVGEVHQLPVLKKYAVYYAPVKLLGPYPPYAPMEECGFGLIVPLKYAWDEYETLAAALAYSMSMNIHFNNMMVLHYERSGEGILAVNNTMDPEGECIATYYNDELFRILGVQPVDFYFRPVKKLLEPLPHNQEFWDIIANHRTVANHPITLTMQGKETECIISTEAFNQPSVNSHGVTFYVTTQQLLTQQLSEKVANGAVKTFQDIIGEDAKLRRLIERARQMAAMESNIMILGESGTGKDVFAQAIHNASRRRDKPFIAINCAALPRDLIESELFGYENGAFTGARKNGNIGKFELAMGGTIFLDEVGEMPLDLQAKLLRVVEQKEIMRLGGNKSIKIDVKIISATNINIREMIEQKKFRADLYYRLSTMRLNLMPLRERRGDIVPLAEYFIRNLSRRIGKKNIMRLSPETKKLLTGMEWRGNVRELQNLIECIVQLYPGDIILPEYIRENLVEFHPTEERGNETPGEAYFNLRPSSLTAEEIRRALKICRNNRTDAAKYLGISRRSLYRKLHEMEDGGM